MSHHRVPLLETLQCFPFLLKANIFTMTSWDLILPFFLALLFAYFFPATQASLLVFDLIYPDASTNLLKIAVYLPNISQHLILIYIFFTIYFLRCNIYYIYCLFSALYNNINSMRTEIFISLPCCIPICRTVLCSEIKTSNHLVNTMIDTKVEQKYCDCHLCSASYHPRRLCILPSALSDCSVDYSKIL